MYQNQFQVPLPLALWLAVDEYDYSNNPYSISATTIMRSPRYIIGKFREANPELIPEHLQHSNFLDPLLKVVAPDLQDRVASRIGTAVHSSAELAWGKYYREGLTLLGYPESFIERVLINPKPEDIKSDSVCIYSENRISKELGRFHLSGQYDFIINGDLHDIKTTSTFVYTSKCNDDKYILQGSIYRWLNPELITGDHITINFVFSDWNKFNAQSNPDYPQAKVISKKYKLMSLEETDRYLKNKLKVLEENWDKPLEQIPCCTHKDLFSKASVFKYYKTGYAPNKRSTKNFNSMEEANNFKSKNGFLGDIVEIKGEPFMCPYCIPSEVEAMSTNLHRGSTISIV